MTKALRELLEQQTNEQLRKIADTARVILRVRRMKLYLPWEESYAGLRQAQPDRSVKPDCFRKSEINRLVSKKVKRIA